ncbi:cytochrome P450 [Streptomyces sp. DT199]|uniref:cytochrome P450 n=1 Tax=Streptomyces sp. DT199 TaxID=3393421 RepID=UPI003CEAF214
MSKETVDRQVTRSAPRFGRAPGAVGLPDQADHVRLRRAVAAAFTARGVERVRERSRRMLAELVDEMVQDGPPADLCEAVLGPFPVAVICELMGVPAADRQGMHTWTRQILSSSPGAGAGEKAKREMGAYFSDLIGLREGGTGEDVASLLGAAVGREEVTLDEAVGLAVLLQVDGEAVTDTCGRMFYVLLTRPELAERLRREPEIRPRAVDELLHPLPHRDPVGLSRIAGEDAMPVRMEAELLVDALLDGVPGLRLAVPAEDVRFRKGSLIRGPEALPVTW